MIRTNLVIFFSHDLVIGQAKSIENFKPTAHFILIQSLSYDSPRAQTALVNTVADWLRKLTMREKALTIHLVYSSMYF